MTDHAEDQLIELLIPGKLPKGAKSVYKVYVSP